MAGTHFKGAVMFSSATPALQNLNIGNWPDQVHVIDDFDQHVFNAGGAAGNFWSIIEAINCPAAVPTLGNDGSLNGVVNNAAVGAAGDGTLIQGNMTYATPATRGDRVYFECRTSLSGAVAANAFAGAPNTFWGMAEEGAAVGDTFTAAITTLVGFKMIAGAEQLTACIKSPSGAELQLTPTDANLATLGTMSQNTFITLGFELVNSPATAATQSQAAVTYDAFPAVGTAAERMGLTWDFDLTAAVANTLSHDYFMGSQDRGITYAPTN